MEDTKSEPACHPQACAIQSCLTKNGFQEEKCQAQINDLYKCCNAFYKQNGNDARTPSCPGPDLLKIKMKQIEQAS